MNFSEFEGKAFEANEIKEHRLEPELKRIKGIGEALVYGDPYGIARKLDGHQGNNIYGCKNNDGLIAVVNVLRMAGINCSENEIVKCAIDNKWCRNSINESLGKPGENFPWERAKLLNHYGISSEALYRKLSDPDQPSAELDSIAEYVESGRGVIMEVYSGLLDVIFYGETPDLQRMELPGADRCVTVTGTARNPETGALEGLFICDSARGGFGNKAIFIPIDILKRVYGADSKTRNDFVFCANVVVTDKPIR